MAQPKALPRLARLALLLSDKQGLLVRLDGALAGLERAGAEVDAEKDLLADFQGRLNQTAQLLRDLEQTGERGRAAEILARLEDLLTGPSWQLAETILPELETRDQQQARERAQRLDEVRGEFAAYVRHSRQVRLWRGLVEGLKRALERARLVGAPVGKEAKDLRRLDALVTQIERALDEAAAPPPEPMDQLAQEAPKFGERVERITASAGAAEPFSRQAEILFLQAPLDAQARFDYQVLLRTPSAPGSHGINIQGSSTLAGEDRVMLQELLDGVTEAVNRGLARQFQLRSASPPGAAPADVPRDLFPVGDAGRPATSSAEYARRIRDLGDWMHRLILPEPMKAYLSDTPCSVTITTNDQTLPWELMAYKTGAGEDTFLCLEKPVARMPLGHAFPRPSRPPARVEKVSFLLVYADPRDSLAAARQEILDIKNALETEWADPLRKGQLEIQVLEGKDASGRKLNEALRDGTFDVIHYAGHAFFDKDRPELSGLLLHPHKADDPSKEHIFIAQKIRRLVEGQPLVFLNACESSRTANEQSAQQVTYLQEKAEGLASAFLYGGARGCIGSLWPVYDGAAARFAIAFYRKALDGQTVGEAVRLARREIKRQFPDQITWAAFVLYGDPTARLPSVQE
jgi:hypothetical protein